MNILITGSSGYLGKYFIDAFSDKYKFKYFSLRNSSLHELNINNIDVVLHCGALVHQKDKHDYNAYYDINVKYPFDLAKKAKESNVKHFIFLSSVAVYGDDHVLLSEDTECAPVTSYGKSKFEAEKRLQLLEDMDFIVSIIRPSMVYGKDAPGNMRTLINLVQSIPVLPLANINNRRNFVYIGNLTYLIDKVIEKRKSGVFLASDDQTISTNELITLISRALNKKVFLIQIPYFRTLVKIVKPNLYRKIFGDLEIDNHVTKEVLDYRNRYTTQEGIKYMIHGEK